MIGTSKECELNHIISLELSAWRYFAPHYVK